MVLFSFTTIADEWKSINLMEKVTVSLPGTPLSDNTKGIPLQKVVLADSSEAIASIVDFSTFGLTEEMLQQLAGTDQFKQMMESQVANQTGVKIIKNEMGKFNDKYTMYDLVIESSNEALKGLLYQRTVFYKKYGINMMYKVGKKGLDEAVKDKLFNSLKIAE